MTSKDDGNQDQDEGKGDCNAQAAPSPSVDGKHGRVTPGMFPANRMVAPNSQGP
jgi:hypothetical protein